MPGLIKYLVSQGYKEPESALSSPEAMNLFLPSSFADDIIRRSICPESLTKIEEELRMAQMSEALANLRRQIRKRMFAGLLKNKNGNGQAYWLRSNSFISQIQASVREHQKEYINARKAMINLCPTGKWQETFRVLEEKDLRGITEKSIREEEAQTLKRTREMAGMGESDDESDESDDEAEAEEDDWIQAIQPDQDPRSVLGEGYRNVSWIWFTYAPSSMADGATQYGEEPKEVIEDGMYLVC
jgi:hypothetical protein